MIWTKSFWKGAAERAFHTFWQTFAAILALAVGGDLIPTAGVEGVNWLTALSGALVATILSLAKSLGSPQFTAGAPAERLAAAVGRATPALTAEEEAVEQGEV